MGKVTTSLEAHHRTLIAAQRMFFVATAPGGSEGHVNCSPKGLDSFRVIDEHTVAYLDFIGSGIETIAHLGDNGRICVMFCAFEGPPKILRLHGTGDVVEPGDAEFVALRALFVADSRAAERAIVRVRIARIAESCGYGVPLYDHVGERDQMTTWRDKKGAIGAADYQREKNAQSLDGLDGLRWVNRAPR